MDITKENFAGDYSEAVGNSQFKNGLSRAVWDVKYGQILDIANQLELNPIIADRKIWKAVVVLDQYTETLYAFTSDQNYRRVLNAITKGCKTHYFYLLSINSDEPIRKQTSLFKSTDDDAERFAHAQEILNDNIELAKHFVVIRYDYSNFVHGIISLLDNQGTELSSMSMDEFLAKNQESIFPKIKEASLKGNTTQQLSKPLVSWKGKTKEIK